MSAGAERHLVVARLREEIRRIERRPARRDGAIACGRAEIDELLPGGGFRRGALTELAGGPASGKTAIALALFAALGPGDLAAYVDGRAELYPPAAAALGVDLARMLVVRPPSRAAGEAPGRDPALIALWAAEALLASGAFAAVAVDLPVAPAVRGADAAARRLQAAAEKGGAVGLWLAGHGVTALRVPAAVRLELSVDAGRIVPRLRSRASAGPTLGMSGPEPARRRQASCAAAPGDGDAA